MQKKNLPQVLSGSEQLEEGFVSVQHNLDILREMNDLNPHTIAIKDDELIGYALAMDKSFGQRIPMLIPMFDLINHALAESSLPRATNYIVMGQVCIAKGFRGQGLFKAMYTDLQLRFKDKYTSLITEVAIRNFRSIKAHQRQGFKSLVKHNSDGEEWDILQWIW